MSQLTNDRSEGANTEDVFPLVDVETSGPASAEYSMLTLGACVVGNPSKTFYRELTPITERFVPEALKVFGLTFDRLKEKDIEPEAAMKDFESWIDSVSDGKRLVFVAFNATFDWMFVTYYFHRFLGRNPFGKSGLDIKAYYMSKLGTSWSETAKKNLDKRFLSNNHRHTHNALEDAI